MFVRRRDWDELVRRVEALEGLDGRIHELDRSVQEFALDYNNLYEKVRSNLAKLRKRVDREEEQTNGPTPDVQKWRQALLQKKMGG